VVNVPGWRRNLHCVCVHFRCTSTAPPAARCDRGAAGEAADMRLPIIIAGDFNRLAASAPAAFSRKASA